jgi:chromosome segregation ATPase
MTTYKFISEKRCQICNVNRDDIKFAFDYVQNQHRNANDWYLYAQRVKKYNNGDYKDFIDEYNSHWSCMPRVYQIDYNERIEVANKKKDKSLDNEKYKSQIQKLYNELDNKNSIIFTLSNHNNELTENINKLNENIDKLKINNVNLIDNRNFLKDENAELRIKLKEYNNLQNIICQKDSEINDLISRYETRLLLILKQLKKKKKEHSKNDETK